MKKITKEQLISWFNTFMAVFLPAIALNIDSLDLTNLSQTTLLAFVITVIRSAIKIATTRFL